MCSSNTIILSNIYINKAVIYNHTRGMLSCFNRFINAPIDRCKCQTLNISMEHWYFKVEEHTRCTCGHEFMGTNGEYFFCGARQCLYFKIPGDYINWRESGHSSCAMSLILTNCRRIVIDEVRCLYDKLQIIEAHLSKDCIRYIVLSYL